MITGWSVCLAAGGWMRCIDGVGIYGAARFLLILVWIGLLSCRVAGSGRA